MSRFALALTLLFIMLLDVVPTYAQDNGIVVFHLADMMGGKEVSHVNEEVKVTISEWRVTEDLAVFNYRHTADHGLVFQAYDGEDRPLDKPLRLNQKEGTIFLEVPEAGVSRLEFHSVPAMKELPPNTFRITIPPTPALAVLLILALALGRLSALSDKRRKK